MTKVAIIGGGPSGLASAKACLEANLVPTVFERDLCLGGLWKAGSGGLVWSSLKTNLSKHTCCFSDFRWPVDTPDFPSSARLRQYIEDYAAHFDLAKHVRFGVSVTAAVPCPAADTGSTRWKITFTLNTHRRCAAREDLRTTDPSITAQEDLVQRTETFDKCIIASGIFSEPHFPRVEGISEAVEQGWATHGAAYRDPGLFAGKSVLVVGCAFSGAEIASDLAGVACRCLAATGRPSIFLPRFVDIHAARGPPSSAGVPQDRAGNVAAKPGNGAGTAGDGALQSAHSVRRRCGDDSSSDKRGSEKHPENPRCPQDTPPPLATASPRVPLDLALYSRRARAGSKLTPALEKLESSRKFLVELAGSDPGDAHEALRLSQRSENSHGSDSGSVRVVVSDDFLDRVRDGCIEIRQRLIALETTGRTVRFSDGEVEEVDHVILCTGLGPSLGFLPGDVLRQFEHDKGDLLQPLILHLQAWNPSVPDLGFVGIYRGPYFGVIELQARWIARMWSGAVPMPTEAESAAALQESRSVRTATPRPQFPTDYVDMMEGLAGVAGLLPSNRKDLSSSPSSAVCPVDCLGEIADSEEFVAMMRSQLPLSGAKGTAGREGGSEEGDAIGAIGVLNERMWSGPLLPCHYRLQHLDARASPFDTMNVGGSARAVDFSSRAHRTESRHRVMHEAIAEIGEVNAKLERAYRARTSP
ncbi:unnamed protein product [Ectocarpus sp. 12 AP-2014]